jgi:RNA 2',3'-cyclic 3'-phosphodiesterase
MLPQFDKIRKSPKEVIMNRTHYFIAIPIKSSIRSNIQNWIKHHQKEFHFKSFVHPEDFHITLVFLGAIEQKIFESLKIKISELIQMHDTFQLSITTPGIFGKKDEPRVLWAGMTDSDPLVKLQNDLVQLCKNLGFHLDDRPYSPHITLARRWKSDNSFDETLLNESMIKEQRDRSWSVEEIVLYQTNMNKTPKYERIFSWTLLKK